MQILLAPTEDVVLREKSFISADEVVGQTTISVENAQSFAANNFVVLGEIGNETAEIKKIASVGSDLLSVVLTVATKFEHLKDSPIQVIRYDKRKFYRSSTETGAYTHLSAEGSPVDIQVDQPEGTEFEDSSGISSSWYKATYYNSVDGSESSTDDAVATKAGDSQHYTSVYKIRVESGFEKNPYIGSDLVDRYRIEAEAQAEGSIAQAYQLPFSSVPRIFQHIVTLLSAGLLLSKEYGLEADVEVSKTGQRKIDRAEELLKKIADSSILLIGEDGTELSKKTEVMASSSNVYDEDIADKGELFNIGDETFNLTDPKDSLASSKRSTKKDTGFI